MSLAPLPPTFRTVTPDSDPQLAAALQRRPRNTAVSTRVAARTTTTTITRRAEWPTAPSEQAARIEREAMVMTAPSELQATSVSEFLALLRLLSARSGANRRQLSVCSGVPKSTVYRMLDPATTVLPVKPTQVRELAFACGLNRDNVDRVMRLWSELRHPAAVLPEFGEAAFEVRVDELAEDPLPSTFQRRVANGVGLHLPWIATVGALILALILLFLTVRLDTEPSRSVTTSIAVLAGILGVWCARLGRRERGALDEAEGQVMVLELRRGEILGQRGTYTTCTGTAKR